MKRWSSGVEKKRKESKERKMENDEITTDVSFLTLPYLNLATARSTR